VNKGNRSRASGKFTNRVFSISGGWKGVLVLSIVGVGLFFDLFYRRKQLLAHFIGVATVL